MLCLAVEWSSLLSEVGSFLLPVFGSLLTIFAVALAKKILDKIGLDRSEKVDGMIDKYVSLAVNSAERFAKKKLDGRDMKGSDKLTMAVSTVLRELDQSGIKGVGEDLIKHRIESYLELKDLAPTTLLSGN